MLGVFAFLAVVFIVITWFVVGTGLPFAQTTFGLGFVKIKFDIDLNTRLMVTFTTISSS
jgi:hypothetical protein